MAVVSEPRVSRRSRPFVPLVSVSLLSGTGYALVSPFMALFLVKELQAGPFAVGAFLLVGALASIVLSTLVGRFSDTRDVRRTLMFAASVVGAVALALFAVLRDYWLLLAVSVTLWAFSASHMPQMFAYARQLLDRSRSTRGAFAISGLRTTLSVAWVGGPPLGALLMTAAGFTGLFTAAAAMYVLTAVATLIWLPRLGPDPVVTADVDHRPDPRGGFLLASAAFVLLQGATAVGVAAMPLFITEDLGGTAGDAGLVLGLCAALEIPLMLGFGALAVRFDHRVLVLAGGALALAYYSVMVLVQATWQVMAAQVLHAVVISAVMGVGISYFQDLAPDRPGYATTLYTNTARISAMTSGPLLGAAQHFGYRTAYGMGLVMSVLGLALLLADRRQRRGAVSEGA
ncbi:sugar efflux transporter [Saccharothrix longispora]|uniref:sugar efflux transporter n=1 Tax=Saccharothrix longispora TaxID=33920 RepID=UPI0028FD40E4|nr:sugar efflux transporter [Saccharothrix longispora]MDU0293910.1 sugar efflux transporter [Saccharothrix longispora]